MDSINKNTPVRVNNPLNLDSPLKKNQLDTIIFDTLITATPDVVNKSYFNSHSSAVTVTNFKNGKAGQDLYIIGNGNTTITNNANIKTSTGANKVLAANKIYHYMFTGSLWIEVTV